MFPLHIRLREHGFAVGIAECNGVGIQIRIQQFKAAQIDNHPCRNFVFGTNFMINAGIKDSFSLVNSACCAKISSDITFVSGL